MFLVDIDISWLDIDILRPDIDILWQNFDFDYVFHDIFPKIGKSQVS